MDGGSDDNNSTTAVSRMLVVGADPEAKRDVIAKLHVLCGQKADAAATATASVQPLTFSTKYYTANVDVHLHQVLENEPVAPLAHELQEYEAVVCVVDVAREESFLHVSRFLKQMSDEQIEVCLLVGCNSQSEKTSQVAQHIERVQAWCLDNEFEFIELLEDADSVPGGNNNQLESDFGADEKQGMDRVLEALHCNMWASMVMRSQQQQQVIEDNGLRELSNVSVALSMPSPDDEKKAPAALGSKQKQEAKTAQLKDKVDSEEEEGGDDDRLQTLLRALEITEAADKATAGSGPSNTSGSNNNQDDDEDDIDMAEFSALISEVRRVRDNGQELTDEQRRQRAAEVAMKLWNFLGADDESDAEDAEH